MAGAVLELAAGQDVRRQHAQDGQLQQNRLACCVGGWRVLSQGMGGGEFWLEGTSAAILRQMHAHPPSATTAASPPVGAAITTLSPPSQMAGQQSFWMALK